jgi:hypothetical protein
MISVLLTDYREPEMTKKCIETLKDASFKDIEILARSNKDNNIGLAASSNILAKQAKGEYLFFLNNDTMVAGNIFEELLKSPHDITGCRMFDYTGSKELSSCVSLDRFGCPAAETGPMFYPDGAIFIKRKVFEEIGGFDEKLFLYGEDRDLCWRTLLAGYSVGYMPDAVFFHNSHSVSCSNYFQRYHAEKNIIRSMIKNFSTRSLLIRLPQYLFWSILELGYVFCKNPKIIFKSYLPAYWWNIINLKDTLRLRRKVIRRIPDSELPFSKVIGKLYVLRTQGIPKWRNRA